MYYVYINPRQNIDCIYSFEVVCIYESHSRSLRGLPYNISVSLLCWSYTYVCHNPSVYLMLLLFSCSCVTAPVLSDFQTKEIPVISRVHPLQLLSWRADRWLLKSIGLLKLRLSEEQSSLSWLCLRSAWLAEEVTRRCHRSRRAANYALAGTFWHAPNDCHRERESCDPAEKFN